MSALINAFNKTTTTNGDVAFESTKDEVLDFFYKAPTANVDYDLVSTFRSALAQDLDLAVRALLWLRDVRQGAGRRQAFRTLVTQLPKAVAQRVIFKIPELGRFDDLKVFFGTELEKVAVEVWVSHIAAGNALAAKWAPRKDSKGARPLRKLLNLTEKEWRKAVVAASNTIEQKLCAGDFENIEFAKQPSQAISRYARALKAKSTSFNEYLASLEKGKAKINAGAIYPHTVVKSVWWGNSTVADAQWKALPNYLEGGKYKNILPVIDVSGSMGSPSADRSVNCMTIAIALGIYVSERMSGSFKDHFITFSESPRMNKILGNTLADKVSTLRRAGWGYNTDLDKVFETTLDKAIKFGVSQEDMPDAILVVSDMQFDRAMGRGRLSTRVRNMYEAAGYQVPDLVFWNVAKANTVPDTANTPGIALVSGFSPSIMKGVLSEGYTSPLEVMKRTILVPRYEY